LFQVGDNFLREILKTNSPAKQNSIGLPNIRIQVNNENLQNPPYLLDAIRHVEAIQNVSLNASQPSTNQAAQVQKQDGQQGLREEFDGNARQQPAAQSFVNKTSEEEYEEGEPHSFSVVKEETIEEILDLDPDSVLKLSPESVMNGVSPSDYTRITDSVAAESTNNHEVSQLENDSKQAQGLVVQRHDSSIRKPQLPVTSSHLKKPAGGLQDDESPASSNGGDQNDTSVQKGPGAKSIVSPSVNSDEPPIAVNLEKKVSQNLPDTWEPSQVMDRAPNPANVPAIVNKEYGSQTRTRVTLGGGYVRDRLPPLVNPASSSYNDDKPEKPVTPLEKPKLSQPGGQKEISRVIETPTRIVVPATPSQSNKPPAREIISDERIESNATIGQLDSRCPKQGVMTFEHSTACDRYFYCEDGYISEQVCPNGLVYGTRDMIKDYCVHRWQGSCDDKTIPNPISSPGCRWQYGIFSVQGSPKCTPDFYECSAGKFEVRKCSIDGQVYDDRTKSCRFAETVGCANEALADFHCPPDDQGNTYWPFPRYFLNERALIHCVNDKPEIVRCTDDERVDPEHLHCVPLSKLSQQSAGSLPTGERRAREKKKV